MTRRFKAFTVALFMAIGLLATSRVVLADGVWDAICSTLAPDDPAYVLLGCTNHNPPNGS